MLIDAAKRLSKVTVGEGKVESKVARKQRSQGAVRALEEGATCPATRGPYVMVHVQLLSLCSAIRA